MDATRAFFRDRPTGKVAAVYNHPRAAVLACARVKYAAGVDSRQVQLVTPLDVDWGRKVEPEGVGIARTAVRAHVSCALLGFVVALVGWLALYLADLAIVASTPASSLFAMLMFGTMFGLLLGGLLTIRPDHDAVISSVREATRTGRWAVVVHPVTRPEFELSVRALEDTGVPVARTP
ncbi:hypothetical protein BURK1_00690 [Burkholderiales bacterium]|nr:hypothetical protein BURK1_00690 [Burkholderiales bacterium]